MGRQQSQSLREIRNRVDRLFQKYETQPHTPNLSDMFIDELSGVLTEFHSNGKSSIYGRDVTERKTLEHRLAYQAELLEDVQDAIVACDPQIEITYWNQAAERLYGWTQAEALGQNMTRLLRSEVSGPNWEQLLQQVRQAGRYQAEVIHHARDGRRLIVEMQTKVQQDISGQVTGYISSIRDVTARKQDEARALELSQENKRQAALLDGVFDADPGGVAVVVGSELTIVYANPAYRYICPPTETDLLGQRYEDIWDPTDPDCYSGPIREVVESGRPFQTLGFKRRFPDGETRVFTLQVRRIEWEGQPAALLALWDTTEQKQIEQALRESEEKFHTSLSSIGDAVITTDEQGKVTFLNPVAESLTGWSSVEAAGQLLTDIAPLIDEQTRQPTGFTIDQILREKRGIGRSQPSALVARDGRVIPIEDCAAPIRSAEDNILGVVIVLRDVTEKHQTEELRRSERIYRAIGELIDYGVWICDPDGRNTYASESFLKLVGITQEECSEFGWGDTLHPDDAERTISAWKECVRTGGNWDIEHRFRGTDGKYHPILARGVPVRDDQGKILCWAGINLDISNLKQAEEAARASEQRVQEILESIQDAFMELDHDWRLTYLNRRAAQNVGYQSPEDLLGKNIWETFPVLTETPLKRFYQQVMDERRPGQMEFEGKLSPHWYDLHAYPSSQGITVYWVDITERKHKEDQLRQQAEILDVIQEAIVVSDLHFQITSWNSAAERIYGWKAEDVLGKHAKEILRSEMTDEERAAVYHELEAGETVITELIQPTRDGQRRTIEGYSMPLQDSKGKAIGYVAVNRDISDKKQVEETHKLNRMLQALGDSRLAMARAEDESSFLIDVCRIVVEQCGHAMAWIGFAEDDAAKSVRPVAHAGHDAGYLDTMHLTWMDTERGRGPSGTAIRTGKPSLSRHILTDPRMEPWRAEAIQRGYASSIVLPILPGETGEDPQVGAGRKAFGVFSIFSRDPDPFSDEEVRLLTELANDLAYGISAIRMKAARRQAEAALRKNEAEARARAAELETMMDTAPAIVLMSRDPECRQMVSNKYGYDFLNMPAGSNISLTAPAENRPTHFAARKDGIELPPDELPMQIAARTGVPQCDYEYDVSFGNGVSSHLFGNATPLFDEQGHPSGAVGIFVDITERTRAEAETRRLEAELEIGRSLLEQREQERLQIARDLHDGPVQDLTATTFLLRGLLMGERASKTAEQLEAVQSSLQGSIQELRNYAGELRPPALSKFGLEKALRSHTDSFQEKHPEIHVDLEVHFTGDLLPEPIRLALYRIYQQALANVVKHTHASEIFVQLLKDEQQAVLVVRDNGQGFVLPKEWLDLVHQGHLGLVGMRERAEAVGGQLQIQSQPGHGTQIQVVVPIQ